MCLFVGEFDHAINLSRPKLIFASNAVIKRAAKISEKNAFVQKVILIDSNEKGKKFNSKLTTLYAELVGSVKVSGSFKYFIAFLMKFDKFFIRLCSRLMIAHNFNARLWI